MDVTPLTWLVASIGPSLIGILGGLQLIAVLRPREPSTSPSTRARLGRRRTAARRALASSLGPAALSSTRSRHDPFDSWRGTRSK